MITLDKYKSLLYVSLMLLLWCVVAVLYFVLSVHRFSHGDQDEIKRYITYDHMLFVAKGCEQFKVEYGQYPVTLSQLGEMRSDFVPPRTQDGWRLSLSLSPYDNLAGYGSVISLGRDAKVGGAGADADLEVRFPLDVNSDWNAQTASSVTKPTNRME